MEFLSCAERVKFVLEGLLICFVKLGEEAAIEVTGAHGACFRCCDKYSENDPLLI